MKSIFFTFETPVTAALIDYSAPLLHTYEFLIITQVHVSVFPLSLHGGRPKLNNVNLAFANLLNREPFFFFLPWRGLFLLVQSMLDAALL